MQYSKQNNVMSITFQLACLTIRQIYYVHSLTLHGSAQQTIYKEIPSKVLLTSGKPRFFCWNCQHMDHGWPFIISTSTLISMNQYVNQASLKWNFFFWQLAHIFHKTITHYQHHMMNKSKLRWSHFPCKFHSSYIYHIY